MVQANLSLPIFLLMSLCLSFLVNWFFLHTGGSVLITVLIHYMVNISGSILGVPMPAMMMIMLVAIILVYKLDKEFGWFRKV